MPIVVPKWAKMSHPNKGVRSSRIIKKVCAKTTQRLREKGLPDAPLRSLWEEGRPGLERTEKVAPVSRRKLISLPSTFRVTRAPRWR